MSPVLAFPKPARVRIRDEAISFGTRAAQTMLTNGRIERHLSRLELIAALAVAYEAGAHATLAKAAS